MTYKLSFDTAYHQIFIRDKASPQDTGDVDFWTDAATHDRLAIGESILGVGLECYGPFKGELVLLDRKNEAIELDQYDHIVEGGLHITSGVLQVLDCPNSNVELEVAVNRGTFRVRIYSMNLASVEDDEGDDFYRIEMWPDTNMERSVLKQF